MGLAGSRCRSAAASAGSRQRATAPQAVLVGPRRGRRSLRLGPRRRSLRRLAGFGGSILKNNMEVEAAMELQRHLDETGVHQVCTIYA